MPVNCENGAWIGNLTCSPLRPPYRHYGDVVVLAPGFGRFSDLQRGRHRNCPSPLKPKQLTLRVLRFHNPIGDQRELLAPGDELRVFHTGSDAQCQPGLHFNFAPIDLR